MNEQPIDTRPLEVGDRCEKWRGYPFNGRVTAVFPKLDGESVRYVVENESPFPGLCLILSGDQIRRVG